MLKIITTRFLKVMSLISFQSMSIPVLKSQHGGFFNANTPRDYSLSYFFEGGTSVKAYVKVIYLGSNLTVQELWKEKVKKEKREK